MEQFKPFVAAQSVEQPLSSDPEAVSEPISEAASYPVEVTCEVSIQEGKEYPAYTVPFCGIPDKPNVFLSANWNPDAEAYAVGAYEIMVNRKVAGKSYNTPGIEPGVEYEYNEYRQERSFISDFASAESAEVYAADSAEIQALCATIGGAPRGCYLGQGMFGIEIAKNPPL